MLLSFHRGSQQGAALGLQLQRGAGAAVAAVVPFSATMPLADRVAAFWPALRLTEAGQQERVGPEHDALPSNKPSVLLYETLGRMFHTEAAPYPFQIPCRISREFVRILQRKAADLLWTGLLLLMRFLHIAVKLIQQ